MKEEITTIEARKNLYNLGLCFKKGSQYTINKHITMEASLMEVVITNELGMPHIIGSWWRDFKIIK